MTRRGCVYRELIRAPLLSFYFGWFRMRLFRRPLCLAIISSLRRFRNVDFPSLFCKLSAYRQHQTRLKVIRLDSSFFTLPDDEGVPKASKINLKNLSEKQILKVLEKRNLWWGLFLMTYLRTLTQDTILITEKMVKRLKNLCLLNQNPFRVVNQFWK